MSGPSDAARAQPDKDLLRFLTCGSVDDGKSTLIGRLLYECALVLDDQLATLERESRRFGTTGDGLDFSLLLDGLEDERQQRITIDVAYRFLPPGSAPLWLRIHRATSSTRGIWRPEHPLPNSRDPGRCA
jgi:hypothetical protein